MLKNSFHTELAIGILISDEETLDAKLDLLTEISLTATNKETFAICEKFRERLCSKEIQESRKYDLHCESQGINNGSLGKKVSDAINGDS
jgi:hypothetical protein